jgi:hypothetical protein
MPSRQGYPRADLLWELEVFQAIVVSFVTRPSAAVMSRTPGLSVPWTVVQEFGAHGSLNPLFLHTEDPVPNQSIAIQADIDLEQLRARLRKMTDTELRLFGKAAKFMCSPRANLGNPPRECFVVQFEEARAEWRRKKQGKASDFR